MNWGEPDDWEIPPSLHTMLLQTPEGQPFQSAAAKTTKGLEGP